MEPALLSFDVPDTTHPESKHRLACWQWGDQRKPAVLCVHGLTRNGRDFDFLAQALLADYCVLCPDMPGRGQSAWLNDPVGYNNATYLADIAFLLKAMNLTQLHWIGTSMGGILGMMAANAFPGFIRKLVLNDIGCLIPLAGLRRIISYPPLPPCPSRTQAEASLRERCAPFGIHDEAHWQHLFTHSLQEKNGCWFTAYDPAIMNAYVQYGLGNPDAADVDLWGLWEAVMKIPVLLIRGAESDILPRETALRMQVTHPQLTLKEIPDTGHAPALMADDQIALIRQWLN